MKAVVEVDEEEGVVKVACRAQVLHAVGLENCFFMLTCSNTNVSIVFHNSVVLFSDICYFSLCVILKERLFEWSPLHCLNLFFFIFFVIFLR